MSTLEERMRRAYVAAMAASHQAGASVRIHVSPDLLVKLREEVAERLGGHPATVQIGAAWGVPVVTDYELKTEDTIIVRAEVRV